MSSKSIEQLENDYWKKPSEFPTALVKKCFEYRKIKVSELTIAQIRLLISQKIGLAYLIPIALDKLEQNVLIEGELYEGDVLESVSKIPMKFWNKNSTEFLRFISLLESNKVKILSELGEKEFDQISERLKM